MSAFQVELMTVNAAMNYIISTDSFEESLFKYFVILLCMPSLTFFCILMPFLRLYINIHLVVRFTFIYYFFVHYLFIYTLVFLEYRPRINIKKLYREKKAH